MTLLPALLALAAGFSLGWIARGTPRRDWHRLRRDLFGWPKDDPTDKAGA